MLISFKVASHYIRLLPGKSNVMDALSFVLGIQSAYLRSQSLKELVYRNGTEAFDMAYVIAFYQSADESVQFKRSVTNTGTSEYRINDKVVPFARYNRLLEERNILGSSLCIQLSIISSESSKFPGFPRRCGNNCQSISSWFNSTHWANKRVLIQFRH